MIVDYYQRELERLREDGALFARKHPALAPLLAGEGTDPDVERLLEGTAFLAAQIREKLDDELPEVIHALLNMVAPHYLRPLPSATIMAFTPRRALRECLTIPRGTEIRSVEVEGTACTFATAADVELAPLQIEEVQLARGQDRRGVLRLQFSTCNNVLLKAIDLDKLRLHFCGGYAEAARRLMLCLTHTRCLRFSAEGKIREIPPSALSMVGFDDTDAIVPYPPRSFPGFRHLQEFFMLPERFCALDVTGFAQWRERGNGTAFSLEFVLGDLPDDCPAFKNGHVRLFVCPAVNIFPTSGEPIRLDYSRASYPVRPSGQNMAHYQVYSVDNVRGLAQGEAQPREYLPFLAANPGNASHPVYSLSSRLENDSLAISIAIGRQAGSQPVPEVLSLDLHCTNGSLPERLRTGEICMPTVSSPLLAEFTNLRPPTASSLPPLGGNTLWRLLSHLYTNFLSMASGESLRSLLKLYIFGKSGDNAGQMAHLKRIDGIVEAVTTPCELLSRGHLLRGQDLHLRVRADNFASDGDLYVFCSVLDAFLGTYAAINTFTRLSVTDISNGREFRWPARLGRRTLL